MYASKKYRDAAGRKERPDVEFDRIRTAGWHMYWGDVEMFRMAAVVTCMLTAMVVLVGCGGKRPSSDEAAIKDEAPSNTEAILSILEQLKIADLSKHYTAFEVEIVDWMKEADNWIAKVNVTATAKTNDLVFGHQGFEKLVHAGTLRRGEKYTKQSFVTFSRFGKGWTPRSVD